MKNEILILLNEEIEQKQETKNIYHPELINKFLKKNQYLNFLNSFSENINKRDENFENFTNLQEELFDEFYSNLNFFFNKNLSKDIWRVLVGSWFHFALETFYNRYFSIKNYIKSDKVSLSYIDIPSTIEQFASKNTEEFITNIDNKNWNSFIYKTIFDELGTPYQIYKKNNKIETNFNKNVNKIMLDKIFYFYNQFALRFNKSLIVDTYLPNFNNILLQLKLRKIPIFRFPDNFKYKNLKKYSIQDRNKFLSNFIKNKNEIDIKIFKKLLTFSIPLSLFENFENFVNEIKKNKTLSNLKFILSSQNYDSNEYFKYIAFINKINKNKLLYIQHGNNTGTSKFDAYDNSLITATNFFTWGYSHQENQIPLFNIKISGCKKITKKLEIGDQMIFYSLYKPIKRYFWDSMNMYNECFDNQLNFIKNLSNSIQSKTFFKFHPTLDDNKIFYLSHNLNEINSNITKISGKIKIKKFKIAIYSYDSTGFYEYLSLNRPVIGLWKNSITEVNEKSKKYYLALKEVGLIHENYIQLAEFLNSNWENLGDWWFSKKVQDAINLFTSEYSLYEKKPVKVFISKIKKII